MPRIFAIFEKINEKYLHESDFEGDEDSMSQRDAGSRKRVVGDDGKLLGKGSSYFGKAMTPIHEEEFGVDQDAGEQKKPVYYLDRGPKWPSFQRASVERFSDIASSNQSPKPDGISQKRIPGDEVISMEIISDEDLFNRLDNARSQRSIF
jgi:hypothetical protein